VLFVSGYAGQTLLDRNVVNVENNFLQKPFTLKQLAKLGPFSITAVIPLPSRLTRSHPRS
jgi:hypothetical protein